MYKLALGIAAGLLLFCNEAMATCSSYPYPLTNGTTADASQVMADLNCAALTSGATMNAISLTGANTVTSSGTAFTPLIIKNHSGLSGIEFREDLSAYFKQYLYDHTGTTANVFLAGEGSSYFLNYVGIGTNNPAQKLDVAGTIRQSGCTTAGTLAVNSSGDIICSSDARLKNIVGTYKDGLSAILRITPSSFSFKPTASNPHEEFVHAGFIAQDVKAAIPQAVALQRNGYYSLDTTAILAASVNAIKELKAANDNQAAEITRLQSQIAVLQRKVGVQAARN